MLGTWDGFGTLDLELMNVYSFLTRRSYRLRDRGVLILSPFRYKHRRKHIKHRNNLTRKPKPSSNLHANNATLLSLKIPKLIKKIFIIRPLSICIPAGPSGFGRGEDESGEFARNARQPDEVRR